MVEKIESSLRDGTMVRHKRIGYEGKIEGTTGIKTCFTKDGQLLPTPSTKEAYQYRIAVTGATLRYIAPADDLEVLAAAEAINCIHCEARFYTRPGVAGKAGGRCACGGWICTACAACQSDAAAKEQQTACIQQRKRFIKKLAVAAKK